MHEVNVLRKPLAVFFAFFASAALATGTAALKPAPTDKCPVCGMFVAKYPDWIAGATFADGSHALFDGPKDLFKFWLDVKGYTPSRSRADIRELFVTDYYSVKQVSAQHAYYVIGSDVFGPMGKELVPFEREADADEFVRDHHGASVLRFSEIVPGVLQRLE